MLEKDVKKALKAYLTWIGAYQYWPVPTGFGAASIDCFFCYQGKFFAVETKRPGVNFATARQQVVLADIAASEGNVCIENDPTLPSVKAMIANALTRRRQ